MHLERSVLTCVEDSVTDKGDAGNGFPKERKWIKRTGMKGYGYTSFVRRKAEGRVSSKKVSFKLYFR